MLLEIQRKLLAGLDAGLPDGQRYSVNPKSEHAAWRLAQALAPWLDDRQAQKVIDVLVEQGAIRSEWFQENPAYSKLVEGIVVRQLVDGRHRHWRRARG